MASITQQKADLRAILHRYVENYLVEHPGEAFEVAMTTVRRFSATYTLQELRDWHFQVILLPALVGGKQCHHHDVSG